MGSHNVTLGQTANTPQAYSGAITSTGGTLTMAGTAAYTQTLSGNNTFAAVAVNGGRLNLNGNSTASGGVTVAGGTLGGTGTLANTGAVAINSGKLAPGTSIGTLGLTGSGGLAMSAGSQFEWEFNSSTVGADLLNDNGPLSLGNATLTALDLGAATLAPNTKLTLMSYNLGSWDSSTFSGIADGGTVTVGANTFTIDYDDTSAGSNGGLYNRFVTAKIASVAPTATTLADYVTYRKSDGSNNGYATFRENFTAYAGGGNAGPSLSDSGLSSGAVPEPGSICLMLLGLAAMGLRRSR
jgi:hypothetical protein